MRDEQAFNNVLVVSSNVDGILALGNVFYISLSFSN
jgi:hypothetical protein